MTDLKVVENKAPTYSVISFKGSELPQAYVNMVLSKWLRSLRFGNPTFTRIDSDQYYQHYEPYIKNLLKKPDSLVKLAVLSDDHDVVLGFSVSREDVIDYIHVHKDQRRQGIARKIFPEGITTMSHFTLTSGLIWQGNKKYKHLKFNPFA